MRVLLVEDSPSDADLVRELLAPHRSLHIEHVLRLDRALGFLRESRPDVVLLDVRLPDSRGLSTVRAVCAAAPDVPVVVLTGFGDEGSAVQAVQAGAQEYLDKNLMSEELLVRTLHHSIERQRMRVEARRLERQARDAERALQVLLEQHVDGMVVVDSDGRMLFANPVAAALLQIGETPLGKAQIPLDPARELDEILVRDPEGREHVVEVRAKPIEWEGRAAHLICLRDITAHRQAEDMRRRLVHVDRLKSIGELAAGVAHEINNPAAMLLANQEVLAKSFEQWSKFLRDLRGVAESWAPRERIVVEDLMQRSDTDAVLAEARQILEENHAGTLRIRSIVKGLRAFARIEREEVEPVRLDRLLDDACAMVRNEVRHRARLHLELDPVPPIPAHPSRLIQVMVNLLVNAVQAFDESMRDANLITARSRAEEGRVVVEIADNGPGVPASLRKRVFEPFFTTKPKDQGTGLGLALSREIAREHGGDLRLVSSEGEGARFELWLPLKTGLPIPRPSADAPLRPSLQPRRARVLLVDDEVMILRAFRRILRADHDVVVAQGGRAAIERLEHDRTFDVIVCDVMMPEVDGLSVYRWMCTEAPELAERMIFISGGAFTARARSFVSSVDCLLLEKPVSSEALSAAVQEVFQRGTSEIPNDD